MCFLSIYHQTFNRHRCLVLLCEDAVNKTSGRHARRSVGESTEIKPGPMARRGRKNERWPNANRHHGRTVTADGSGARFLRPRKTNSTCRRSAACIAITFAFQKRWKLILLVALYNSNFEFFLFYPQSIHYFCTYMSNRLYLWMRLKVYSVEYWIF